MGTRDLAISDQCKTPLVGIICLVQEPEGSFSSGKEPISALRSCSIQVLWSPDVQNARGPLWQTGGDALLTFVFKYGCAAQLSVVSSSQPLASSSFRVLFGFQTEVVSRLGQSLSTYWARQWFQGLGRPHHLGLHWGEMFTPELPWGLPTFFSDLHSLPSPTSSPFPIRVMLINRPFTL